MKKTYYAIIDGKEIKMRTSEHEYHFSTKGGKMMAKTKEELMKRIHTYCYDNYNWCVKHSRIKRTKEELELIKEECEQKYQKWILGIVEVYTKVSA